MTATAPSRRPSYKDTYWCPKEGGYAEYVGTGRPDRRGLCMVIEVEETETFFPFVEVSSFASNDASPFRCSAPDLREVAIIVVGKKDTFCSHTQCGRTITKPSTAMSCEHCHRRFVAICDYYEGAFLSAAELRKEWPLKVIPYHTMTLSRGWHPKLPESMRNRR
jgi:hypothetical protein